MAEPYGSKKQDPETNQTNTPGQTQETVLSTHEKESTRHEIRLAKVKRSPGKT